MTRRAVTRSEARALAVINHLLPMVRAYGLQIGFDATRWVSPPWSVLVRSRLPTHRIEIACGRAVLEAEWREGGELVVRYFALGDWDRDLLKEAA